jgi:DNA-binding response OmpR family regulator
MRTEQILVVDDKQNIVKNISLFLKREGFETTGARDGEQALKNL